MTLAGCAHLEIWESASYVAPGSNEEKRVQSRLDTLYNMSCKVGGDPAKRSYIVNGKRVVLMVPAATGAACRDAIPYAICDGTPDRQPDTLCRRIK
jgi:hypothetical protein